MIRNCLIISLLLQWSMHSSGQTSIGGVINNYAKVLTYENLDCQAIVTVEESLGFSAGDQVLVIQMQGALVEESNSASFGSITEIGKAGSYEFNQISMLTDDQITLSYPLSVAYEPFGSVQIVRVPVYEAATITAPLVPKAWDGSIGGVLIFEVNGRLTLSANVQADGLGFRGGAAATVSGNDCSWFNEQDDYFFGPDDWRGAAKGEGIAVLASDKRYGKGPQANGGGGGNDHNAGGGGGALLSAGGQGGENEEPSLFGCDGSHPGLGGNMIMEESDRFFMGGGGGAGHENNEVGTDGGNGGGLIIIKADSLFTQGFSISANGASPEDGGGDGAGGGGAAGTIVLQAEYIADELNVFANGGNGGLINNNNAERCHGPGGGGSGGQIKINFPVLPVYNLATLGGAAGMSVQSATCVDGQNGATDGAPGSIGGFVSLVHSADYIELPIADFTFSLLSDNTVQFNNNSTNFESLIWDFAGQGTSISTNPQFTFDEAGEYEVILLAQSACGTDTAVQTITILEEDPLSIAFSFDDGNGCAPHSVTFENQSAGNYESIEWTFEGGTPASSTEPNPTIFYDTPGLFDVQLTLDGNAVLSESDLINITPAVEAIFAYNIDNNTVEFFNVSTNATAYQWDFGDGSPNSLEQNPVHTYSNPGTYNVTLVATSPYCGKAITESIFVDFPSSVERVDQPEILIFPNPVKDILTVTAPDLTNYSLVLRSLTGTRLTPLMQRSAQQAQVNLSTLSSGVYVLSVQGPREKFIFKVIKVE